MCSVVGWSGVWSEELIISLMNNSRIRGLHAFGYSFYLDDDIITKKFLKYEDFINELKTDKPTTFISHFRYSTSGDWKDIDNNQPIYNNSMAIAFNGVISQKTKSEMEAEYNIQMAGDNDGFLLLDKIDDIEFLSRFDITYALVGLDKDGIFAMRNKHRPLWKFNGPDFKGVCSTNDILFRSGLYDTDELRPLKKIYLND